MQTEPLLLSIAIPTYNRNVRLNETLSQLLPQITESCELLIIDNASQEPVSSTSASLLANYPKVRFRIVRNRANIGSSGNVARCLELAEAKHVWVLSDDDHVRSDSIELIQQTLKETPNAVYLNFSTEMCIRKATVLCAGLEEFVKRMDSFPNILFISTSIFDASIIRNNLFFANHYCYTMAPHFAALLMSLNSTHISVLSDKQIVDCGRPFPEQRRWSQVHQVLASMALLELPLVSSVRRQLAMKLVPNSAHIARITFHLLKEAAATKDPATSAFYYDHIRYRLGYYERRLHRQLLLQLCRVLITFPSVSMFLLKLTSNYLGFPPKESFGTKYPLNYS